MWCAAGCLLIAAGVLGSRHPEVWIAGVALVATGVFTARSYFKKAPALRIEKGNIIFGSAIYNAGDISSVRHIAENGWNWVRIWNVLALILLVLFIVLFIASLFGGEGGGDGIASIGEIFMPGGSGRKHEVLVLRFKDGSTRRILSSMYNNYYQLRDGIHILLWSIRPRV